jgi:TnpA family transposase
LTFFLSHRSWSADIPCTAADQNAASFEWTKQEAHQQQIKCSYSENAKSYPMLLPFVGGTINLKQLLAQWSEILRLACFIRLGTVTSSLILRKLASYPRQNGLALALREFGRIERTLSTLDWLLHKDLRQRVTADLNKGRTQKYAG